MPTQSPKHAIHTLEHENVPEEAPPKKNSPNFSFVNIDSDTNSSEEMMSGFEPQAQKAENLPLEDYPSFEQEIVQEIFEKFQNNKAMVPNPVATMPLEKDDNTVARQYTKVPKPKCTVLLEVTEPEVIDVLHQPSLPPPDISTPLTTSLSLYQ